MQVLEPLLVELPAESTETAEQSLVSLASPVLCTSTRPTVPLHHSVPQRRHRRRRLLATAQKMKRVAWQAHLICRLWLLWWWWWWW